MVRGVSILILLFFCFILLFVFGTDDGFVLRFVYQVVVPKALAPKELVSIFEGKEKTVLPPWDPMVRSFLLISLFWINSSFLSRVLLHDNDILG